VNTLNFISLAETIRLRGVTQLENNKIVTAKEKTSIFHDALNEAEIFILADTKAVNELVFDKDQFSKFSEQVPINQPFRVVAVEALSGVLKIRNPNDLDDPIKVMNIKCLVSVEFEPGIYALFGNLDTPTEERVVMISNDEAEPLLRFIFDSLAESEIGTESVNERVKLSTGGSKTIRKIKRVIHICGKRDKTKLYGTREVDWSHAWSVRGHWRKIPTIGKNRLGEYVVKGFTWVADHQKGPESKDLVSKVRVLSRKK